MLKRDIKLAANFDAISRYFREGHQLKLPTGKTIKALLLVFLSFLYQMSKSYPNNLASKVCCRGCVYATGANVSNLDGSYGWCKVYLLNVTPFLMQIIL